MALSVPSFPDPTSSSPVADAYASRTVLNVDARSDTGNLTYLVYRDEAACVANLQPVGSVSVPFGSDFGGGKAMPSALEFLAAPELQEALTTIFNWLDGKAVGHPALAGATQTA